MVSFVKKNFMSIFGVGMIIGFAVKVFAQTSTTVGDGIPSDPSFLSGLLPQIVSAFHGGSRLIAGAALVMALVWAVKAYALPKLGLSTSVLPLVSLVLGLLYATALSVSGGLSAHDAWLAAMSGPLASQLWDVVISYLVAALSKKSEAPALK